MNTEPSGDADSDDAPDAPDDAPVDSAPADADDSPTERPFVRARGLGLSTGQGRVYGPVDLDLPSGGLTLLRNAPGTGRSALLLTLAGRMTPGEGELEVGGETAPRRIFPRAAVAGFHGIDELDPGVTIRSVLTEQRSWLSPWWRPVRRATGADVANMLGEVFGDRPLPDTSTRIGDLDDLDDLLLRIGLALAADPELICVDDLEQVRVADDRAFLGSRLVALGADHTVLAATVDDLPAECGPYEFVDLSPGCVDHSPDSEVHA